MKNAQLPSQKKQVFFEDNHFEETKQYIRRITEYSRDIHTYQLNNKYS